MGLATNNFRIHNAAQFVESFTEAEPTRYYFFIARPQPWTDDGNPPTENNSAAELDYRLFDESIAMKRITGTDVAHVIPRYNWSADTVYTEYDNTVNDLSNTSFYVVTDELNIYKCLNNNAGSNSTVKPTGTPTSNLIFTADGYVWKYLLTVSSVDASRFLTDTYVPVKTLKTNDGSLQWQVQENAANGSIDIVKVLTGGSGYTATHDGTLAAVANSTTVDLPLSGTSSANGTYTDSAIYLTGGTGSGQLRKITNYVANSTVRRVTVAPAFANLPDTTSQYSITPSVNLEGDGQGFIGYANVSGGSITNVLVLNPGENYTYSTINFGASTGSGATARGIIPPRGGHASDPVKELFAYNVMVDVRLQGDENDTFTVLNDYRRIGIVIDPLLESNGNVAEALTYDLTTNVTVTSPSGQFLADETITGDTSGTEGTLVEFTGNTSIKLTGVRGDFTASETLRGGTSNVTATYVSSSPSDIRKYSGEIIYYENRRPIPRSSDQSEFIRLTIRF